MVGSCGRLGAITEVTFKVFPESTSYRSYRIDTESHQSALATIASLARGRWELDAIDYCHRDRSIWIRIGGTDDACEAIAKDIQLTLGAPSLTSIESTESDQFWSAINRLRFGTNEDDLIAKVPTDHGSALLIAVWCDTTSGRSSLHISVAGALGWLAFTKETLPEVDALLTRLDRPGMLVRGGAPDRMMFIGRRNNNPIDVAVKNAMDPPGRFPSIEN